jgi:hypothetical protein
MFDFFVDIRDISKPMAMIPQSEKNISWGKMLQKGGGVSPKTCENKVWLIIYKNERNEHSCLT